LHIPFKYLILYNNNNLISYTMKKNKKIPNTPKYAFGGIKKIGNSISSLTQNVFDAQTKGTEKVNNIKSKFNILGGLKDSDKENVKDFAGNYGKFLLDNSANLVGIDAVGAGKAMNYSGRGADEFNKVSNVTGQVAKNIAPIAANIIAPGSGKFVSMGQQVAGGAYNKFGPQNEEGYNAYDSEGNPIVNQNDRSAQFGQMAGQIGGMAGSMMGAGFMPNLPSGIPVYIIVLILLNICYIYFQHQK